MVALQPTLASLTVNKPDSNNLTRSDCEYLEDDIVSHSTDAVGLVLKLFAPDTTSSYTQVEIPLDKADLVLAGLTNLKFSILNAHLLDVPEHYLDGSEKIDLKSIPETSARWLAIYQILSEFAGLTIQSLEAYERGNLEEPSEENPEA